MKLPDVPDGEIVGRVAVADAPQVTDTGDCYIGSSHFVGEGMTVYSWAAPIAKIFFTETEHPLCHQVQGVRTFTHEGGRINDFSDERRSGSAARPLFAQRTMTVAAPSTRPLPRPAPTPPAVHWSSTSDGGRDAEEIATPRSTGPASPILATTKPEADQGGPSRNDTVRARELLERNLRRARTGQLESVLATLQSDQYDLVTRHGHDDLIIDGHPGTGKTVIAVHRAAYLTSPDYNHDSGTDEQIRRLLLVGPTDEYVAHVAPAISRLSHGAGEVHVMSLRGVLGKATGLTSVPEGRAITRIDDGDSQLWSLAYNAASIMNRVSESAGPRSTRIRRAYEIARRNGEGAALVTTDDRWIEYLASLPSFENARQNRAHIPLIAALGWCIAPPQDLRSFDHIIVDEAQDVMAIEWVLLDAMNQDERWTLLGDMNQRRSDAAHGSWNYIADALAILDSGGEAPVTRIRRGYRSTPAIMSFANRLLPKHSRDLESFQTEGAEVVVHRTERDALLPELLIQVRDLAERHPGGSIAIIAMERPVVEDYLRQKRWQSEPHQPHRWRHDGLAVDLVSPDAARGLEWDAVVVVEPAKFPKNFLRHGLLYTSLTRANRELQIVHSQALPEPLRDR
ncbi:AAA family ATPase [Demequina sediminicola]|uniref:AAA family ATPase n=1 Tax=Demequina sediminicola TaxID=1095026 RepID=UPI00128BB77F|nr:AAA family ATPase [Demequina sediminicola]